MTRIRHLAYASLLAFTTPSFAQYLGLDAFNGFYAGGALGGSLTTADQTQAANVFAAQNAIPGLHLAGTSLNGSDALDHDTSLKGALFLGYGRTWGDFYLGAEIFVDASRYENNSYAVTTSPSIVPGGFVNVAGFTHTHISPFQFGIDLRPGIMLTPNSLLYAKIGVAFADIDLETNVSSVAVTAPVVLDSFYFPTAISDSHDKAALRLGFGMEHEICNGWNARLDYTYTDYGHLSVANSAILDSPLNPGIIFWGIDNATEVHLKNHSLMLGLSYNFY